MSMSAIAKQWKVIGDTDFYPPPGTFLSYKWSDYEFDGEIIHAANGIHAEFLWISKHLTSDRGRACAHCNHQIRYAVLIENEDGERMVVGRDCAKFFCSGLDKKTWRTSQILAEIKTVNTQNGERSVYSFEAPDWLWNIPRENRPKFLSLKKWNGASRFGNSYQPKWFASIWGETPGDVLVNLEEFKKLNQ